MRPNALSYMQARAIVDILYSLCPAGKLFLIRGSSTCSIMVSLAMWEERGRNLQFTNRSLGLSSARVILQLSLDTVRPGTD